MSKLDKYYTLIEVRRKHALQGRGVHSHKWWVNLGRVIANAQLMAFVFGLQDIIEGCQPHVLIAQRHSVLPSDKAASQQKMLKHLQSSIDALKALETMMTAQQFLFGYPPPAETRLIRSVWTSQFPFCKTFAISKE